MNPALILYPAVALVWWTLAILLLIPYRRLNPRLNGGVGFVDYELGESANVEPYVSLANRNYMNLLELPVLFYVACLTLFVTGGATRLAISLAWLYVGSRVVHSLVHVTYNRVPHRFLVFVISNLILTALLISMTASVLELGRGTI